MPSSVKVGSSALVSLSSNTHTLDIRCSFIPSHCFHTVCESVFMNLLNVQPLLTNCNCHICEDKINTFLLKALS